MSTSHKKNPSVQTQVWKNVEYPSYYANFLGVGLSPFDISIILGEIAETTPNQITANPKAKVLLSPEQASNLIEMLTAALEAYSKAQGPLRNSAVSRGSVKADLV